MSALLAFTIGIGVLWLAERLAALMARSGRRQSIERGWL
jgi:hypothetical protein